MIEVRLETASDPRTPRQCCLLMIVKNELNVITRALDSAKHLFDYFLICDTGSTDGTPEKIMEWADLHNKHGK